MKTTNNLDVKNMDYYAGTRTFHTTLQYLIENNYKGDEPILILLNTNTYNKKEFHLKGKRWLGTTHDKELAGWNYESDDGIKLIVWND